MVRYLVAIALCFMTPAHAGFMRAMAEMVGIQQKPTFQEVTGKHIGIFRGTVGKTILDLEQALEKQGAQSRLHDKTTIPFRSLSNGVFVLFWKKTDKKQSGRVKQVLRTRTTPNGKLKRFDLPATAVAQNGFRVFYGDPRDPSMKKLLGE